MEHALRVLCVDLDGTLIKTDMLYESFWRLIKQNPLSIFLLPFWLLGGKANFKREIAKRISFSPEFLPYNEEVLAFLKKEHSRGRKLVLATASDELLAAPIAEYLEIFEEVVASDGRLNIAGSKKASTLKERYGDFDYAGNEKRDLKVWENANECILVGSNINLRDRLEDQGKTVEFFQTDQNPNTFIKALRVHQWVKNTLVFVPLVMAHKVHSVSMLLDCAAAFLSFSFCASSVYMLNDLLDLESDRAHQRKRHRPFASGTLPINKGLIYIPLLLMLSGLLSLILPLQFTFALTLYFLLTTVYSLILKQVVLVDILVLASLYTVRIFAGGLAVSVPVSQWLLAFSMFLFLSLACVKRFSELLTLRKLQREEARGRGYFASDLEQIAQFGSASGYISVLVLALYVSSNEVAVLYRNPTALWLICPLLLYWISRTWLLAHRGTLHDDPIVFALTDKVSYLVGVLSILVMLVAI